MKALQVAVFAIAASMGIAAVCVAPLLVALAAVGIEHDVSIAGLTPLQIMGSVFTAVTVGSLPFTLLDARKGI